MYCWRESLAVLGRVSEPGMSALLPALPGHLSYGECSKGPNPKPCSAYAAEGMEFGATAFNPASNARGESAGCGCVYRWQQTVRCTVPEPRVARPARRIRRAAQNSEPCGLQSSPGRPRRAALG